MAYEYYNFSQFQDNPEVQAEKAKNDATMQRLFSMAQARGKYMSQLRQQEQDRMNAELAQQQHAESEQKLNWMDDASKGAQMGSVGGPWGMLAGAIIGTIKGQHEAYKERQHLHPGENGLLSYLKVATDNPFTGHQHLDMNTAAVGGALANRVMSNHKAPSDQDLANKYNAESADMLDNATSGMSDSFSQMQNKPANQFGQKQSNFDLAQNNFLKKSQNLY